MKSFISFVVTVIIFFQGTVILYGQKGCWSTKTNMSVPRNLLSIVELNGIIYAIGGASGAYSSLNVVEAYDTITGTWTDRANLPRQLCGTSGCAINNKIYVFGGAVGGELGNAGKTVYEFTPDSNSWTRKTDIPVPVFLAIAQAVNGNIYLIGGTDTGYDSAYNSVYAYNPYNDTWTQKEDMPTARFSHSSAVVDGKIYVFGGATDNNLDGISSVEAYDPASDIWTEKTPTPKPICLHTSSAVNGKIYLFTGGGGFSSLYDDVDEYDPVSDTWTTKTSIPTPRWGAGSCTTGGKVYVIGGANINNVRLSKVEEYDPALDLTDVKDQENQNDIFKEYNLYQNFPNPFNPGTTFRYSIPNESKVIVKVYDLLGNEIETLVNEEKRAGTYEVTWYAENLPSGVYFYQLKAGNFIQTKKMTLIK